jgi:hypothetical protein
MIIGYARVPTSEQNLGLEDDDLMPAFDASVDQTEACWSTSARRKNIGTAGRGIGVEDGIKPRSLVIVGSGGRH